MKRLLLPVVGFGLVATVLVAAGLIVAPERRELLLDLYVLALGAIAVIRVVSLIPRTLEPGERSEFEEALRPRRAEALRIAELDKTARELELGMQTAFDFHFRLRPVLVDIASSRLAGRGETLANEERGRRLLGDEAWELLRPDRDLPRDRNAPGPPRAQLDRVIARLERI